jgi:ABC-type transport system substrate-binding protein
MKQSKLMLVVGFIVLASMILSACQPVVTTVEVKVTSVVKETQLVKETQVVNQTSVVEQTKVVQVERKPFTTPHPILGDVRVRKAIAYCTNKADIAKAVYPTLTDAERAKLLMNSWVPSDSWAYAGDANITLYPFQKDVGKSVLQDAGWKLPDGGAFGTDYLQNAAGDQLSLKFTTTNSSFRQTWGAVFVKQMKDCGINIIPFYTPASWWFGDTTGLGRRDYELGAYAWVSSPDPSGQSLYACNQIPFPDNGWAGQNTMGWCNEKASTAIIAANNTLVKADRITQYKIHQQEFTKDLPSLPLFQRPLFYAYNPKLEGFKQTAGNQYWDYNLEEMSIPGKDTIVIGTNQEPSGMFFQNQDAWIALAISQPLGTTYYEQNWDYKPLLQKDFSTIENKGAVNNDVDVKEGDMVYDATGTPVKLAAGVKVTDSTGAAVEYKSGMALKMKQLVVTYNLMDGLKWQDGQPIVKADLELGYKLNCDKSSGAVTYTLCDQTQKFEALGDTTEKVTWLPGSQYPLYYIWPYSIYPAHQPITSSDAYKGKTLADVAVKDWATLAEMNQMPWSFGPYIIAEWKKTQYIKFTPNKYWPGAAPKTPTIIWSFLTTDQLVPQLLTGQVDMLGDEALLSKDQKLVDAEKAGKVKTFTVAGSTWEHIDFQLFVK